MSRNCICNIPGGTIVVTELEGVEVRCLKAQRIGRDYVHYYLVPLDPPPADPRSLRLIYADPDSVLTVVRDAAIEIAPAEPAEPSLSALAAPGSNHGVEVGDVFANQTGHFLKVFDTAKTERYHAYVDLASGLIRPRQERNVTGVFRWRLATQSDEGAGDYMS